MLHGPGQVDLLAIRSAVGHQGEHLRAARDSSVDHVLRVEGTVHSFGLDHIGIDRFPVFDVMVLVGGGRGPLAAVHRGHCRHHGAGVRLASSGHEGGPVDGEGYTLLQCSVVDGQFEIIVLALAAQVYAEFRVDGHFRLDAQFGDRYACIARRIGDTGDAEFVRPAIILRGIYLIGKRIGIVELCEAGTLQYLILFGCLIIAIQVPRGSTGVVILVSHLSAPGECDGFFPRVVLVGEIRPIARAGRSHHAAGLLGAWITRGHNGGCIPQGVRPKRILAMIGEEYGIRLGIMGERLRLTVLAEIAGMQHRSGIVHALRLIIIVLPARRIAVHALESHAIAVGLEPIARIRTEGLSVHTARGCPLNLFVAGRRTVQVVQAYPHFIIGIVLEGGEIRRRGVDQARLGLLD